MPNIRAVDKSRIPINSGAELENSNNNNDDDAFGYDDSSTFMDRDFDKQLCSRFGQSVPSFDADCSSAYPYGDGCGQYGNGCGQYGDGCGQYDDDSLECESECLDSLGSSCSRTMVNVSCRAVATPSDCGLGYQYQIIDIKTYPETGLLCCPPGNNPNPVDLDSSCTKVPEPPDCCPSWSSDLHSRDTLSSLFSSSKPSRPSLRRRQRSSASTRSPEPSGSLPPSSSSKSRSSYTHSSNVTSQSRTATIEDQTQSSSSTKSNSLGSRDTECQTRSSDSTSKSKGLDACDEVRVEVNRVDQLNVNENNVGSDEENGSNDNQEPEGGIPEEDVTYDGYSDLDESDIPRDTLSSENIKSAVLNSLQSQMRQKTGWSGSFSKSSKFSDSTSMRRSPPGLKSLPKYHPSERSEFVVNEVDYHPMLSLPRFKTSPDIRSSSMSATAGSGSFSACDRHQAKMMKFLRNLYCQRELTDVSIQVGCSCFNAHRVVLSCYSKYFANRLIQKSCCPIKNTIMLENNISAKTFSAILNFMYTGECQIDRGNLAKMFTAADFLEINSLKARCERLLCSGFKEGSTTNKSQQLEKQWQQVARNFRVISRTDQFLNLSPDCIQKLLCRDDLAIDSEMEVAKAAVRWLNFDREKRKRFTRSVMSCIRFKDLWPEELVRLTNTHQSLLADNSIKEAIFEANWYHTCQQRENSSKLSSSLD